MQALAQTQAQGLTGLHSQVQAQKVALDQINASQGAQARWVDWEGEVQTPPASSGWQRREGRGRGKEADGAAGQAGEAWVVGAQAQAAAR